MKNKPLCLAVGISAALAIAGLAQTSGAPSLQVNYGSSGVQTLTYGGVPLEDTSENPADAFHIWHMKMTDLQGNVLSGGQYDWGELNDGRTWDPGTHTWNYCFSWGAIAVQFVQTGDTLDMNVTVQNSSGSGVIFNGATIYPFVLRFPQLPKNFTDPAYEHLTFNTTGPSVTLADFGSGEVAAVVNEALKPLYSGFEPAGSPNAYFPVISGTGLDNMATFFPHNDRAVMPGETEIFTVSLRFAPSGTPVANLASDVYQTWSTVWPAQLNWTDRRIIGTVFLASSAEGTKTQPLGFPNNPRRYFNDDNPNDFDIRTSEGLTKFQNRILQQAVSNVQNLQRMNAQGAITWDIEGQQYPHDTSYPCAPDQIGQLAPEMESIVSDESSPYSGMKLDNAYFKIIRDAGFRVGVCIRPQHFTVYSDGSAAQIYLPTSQVASELLRKMKYAHDRWGATLFYLDSVVEENGVNLDPAIFQQLSVALPDSLVMPEESTAKYYAYTAPFQSFIFHTDLGTPADTYNYYPNAFSVNLVNDVDPVKLEQYRPQLTAAVRRGDILMVHADYWQDNNPTVVQIYQDAGVAASAPDPAPIQNPTSAIPTPDPTPSPAPTPVAPDPVSASSVTIRNVTAGQTLSGVFNVTASISRPLDAAGSYLIVDGDPLDGHRVTSAPFAYTLDTTTLSDGPHNLQIWAHDFSNATLLSGPINFVVSNMNELN